MRPASNSVHKIHWDLVSQWNLWKKTVLKERDESAVLNYLIGLLIPWANWLFGSIGGIDPRQSDSLKPLGPTRLICGGDVTSFVYF